MFHDEIELRKCECCGEDLPLTDFYIDRGRFKKKCKHCMKKLRKAK